MSLQNHSSDYNYEGKWLCWNPFHVLEKKVNFRKVVNLFLVNYKVSGIRIFPRFPLIWLLGAMNCLNACKGMVSISWRNSLSPKHIHKCQTKKNENRKQICYRLLTQSFQHHSRREHEWTYYLLKKHKSSSYSNYGFEGNFYRLVLKKRYKH